MDENTTSSPSLADYYSMIKAEHEANNAWSAEQAQKAMDYQTQMSNTAHQREVADLKAAGLNPVLSAGGSGATTGSGLQASRSDENVTALYGLTKQAIDGMTAAVKSMSNSAKYYSGSAGVSNATGSSGNLAEVIGNAASDALYRLTGIKQSTSGETIKDAVSYGILGLDGFLSRLGVDASKVLGVSKESSLNKVPISVNSNKKLSSSKGDTKKANPLLKYSYNARSVANQISNSLKSIVKYKTKK